MHQSRPPDLVPHRFDLMASTYKDRSSSFRDLGILFVATIMDAKDFIGQLEATFCDKLWPAFCCELDNSICRITELEKFADVTNNEREERQHLESQRQDERNRLRADNNLLRMELEKLLTKGARVETDNQILQSKLQTLLEQNLNVEKQRQSLADKVAQLQLAAKFSTTKELLLKAENHKLAKTRSQFGKSEVLHNRLSLKNEKKLLKAESPSSLTGGKDVEPVSSEDHQNSEENSPVRTAFRLQDVDQGRVSDLEKNGQMRERSPFETEALGLGEAFVVSLESPPSAEAMRQGEQSKDSPALGAAQNISCPQIRKSKCDGESRACPPAEFVDSDETVMDAVQGDPISAGIVQEYPRVSISNEAEAEPCDEPLRLPSGTVIDAIPCGAKGQKKMEEDSGAVRKTGPLVAIAPNLPNLRPPIRTKVVNTSVKGHKEQSWRQTRHRAEPSEMDPHDSFLDTPRERVLAQLEAARTAQSLVVPQGSRGPVTNKLRCGRIEAREGEKGAERRDHPSATLRLLVEASNAGSPVRKETTAAASKAPSFKFNEPVRKKRDREALQGTDCKICKKFYDAVAAGDADGMLEPKCEHQDAVSRHRFRYLPPPTPEGFWNIGFDDSVKSPDHGG